MRSPKTRRPTRLALLAILPTLACPAVGETLVSGWAGQNHRVSAEFDSFWQQPRNALRLDSGWLYARNDQENLYLLLDLTGDTTEDRPRNAAPVGDYISLVFDLDLDHRITPDRDIAFGLYPGSHRLGKQYFKGPGRFTGLEKTAARLAARFAPSPALAQRHGIWELSIPLRELNGKPGGRLRLGLTTHSDKPRFTHRLPPNQTGDFAQLMELSLAGSPRILSVARIDPQSLRRFLGNRRIVVRPDMKKLNPVGGQHPGLPPGCDFPQGEPQNRIIKPDGTVELVYANGSRKQYFNGGWKLFCPDGTPIPVMVLKSTQMPPTLPPTLPDPTAQQWLEHHNMGLLGVISQLVDDPQMVDNYLASENGGWGVYEQIEHRLETIDYLLAE